VPLQEYCHNSENTTFQERGKPTGLVDAIASNERHFSPLAAILENRRVTLFCYVEIVSGIPPVGITQNKRFLSCDTVFLGVQYVLTKVIFWCESVNVRDHILHLTLKQLNCPE
jgi:hypothetical protein